MGQMEYNRDLLCLVSAELQNLPKLSDRAVLSSDRLWCKGGRSWGKSVFEKGSSSNIFKDSADNDNSMPSQNNGGKAIACADMGTFGSILERDFSEPHPQPKP